MYVLALNVISLARRIQNSHTLARSCCRGTATPSDAYQHTEGRERKINPPRFLLFIQFLLFTPPAETRPNFQKMNFSFKNKGKNKGKTWLKDMRVKWNRGSGSWNRVPGFGSFRIWFSVPTRTGSVHSYYERWSAWRCNWSYIHSKTRQNKIICWQFAVLWSVLKQLQQVSSLN